MRRRIVLIAVVAMLLSVLGGGIATAGEWNPGHFNAPGGDVPGKYKANSECVFNGLDEPDESALGAGDGEPIMYFADDEVWGLTPAGGRVQSAGQLVAAGLGEPGEPGEACNGHTAGLK